MKVDSSEFKMGEIYFRYPAQTTKILASDLRRIINEEISNRLRHTIGNISKLVDIGDNAAILNTVSGEIELSNTTTKLIIDESILSRLNLIKEGHFVDKEGSPAYIIKGEIESSNIEVIEKIIPSIINETDIFEYFLNSKCEFPKVVIERLVFSQSAYNPIHFFIKEAGFTKEDAVKHIECLEKPEINQLTKDKILERINGYNYNSQGKILENIHTEFKGSYLNMDSMVEQIMVENNINKSKSEQLKRTLFYNSLVARTPIPEDVLQKELKCMLEVFSNLKGEHLLVDKDYYLNILKSFFPLDKLTTPLISLLRKAICFTDEVYYKH